MTDEKVTTWAGDVSPEVQSKMGGEMTAEDVEYLIALDFEIWCRNYAYFKGIDGKKKYGLPPNIPSTSSNRDQLLRYHRRSLLQRQQQHLYLELDSYRTEFPVDHDDDPKQHLEF